MDNRRRLYLNLNFCANLLNNLAIISVILFGFTYGVQSILNATVAMTVSYVLAITGVICILVSSILDLVSVFVSTRIDSEDNQR